MVFLGSWLELKISTTELFLLFGEVLNIYVYGLLLENAKDQVEGIPRDNKREVYAFPLILEKEPGKLNLAFSQFKHATW